MRVVIVPEMGWLGQRVWDELIERLEAQKRQRDCDIYIEAYRRRHAKPAR